MMSDHKVLSFIRRLAPFESIWLILVKVLLINKVSGRQVIDLIKKPGMEDSRNFSWWAKGSIDQGRLEDALGYQRGDLDDSFLTMVPRDHLHYTGPQIWHCPSCIKVGYHSSLFCLRKIQSCPWHGDKLVGCTKCYDLLSLLHLPSKKSRSFPAEPERICEHILPLAGRFIIPDLSAPIFQVMNSWYRDFAEWLAASEKIVGGDIFRWIESPEYKHDLDDMILQYLEDKTHIPKPFNSRLNFPVTRLSLEYSFEREGGVSIFCSADASTLRLYDVQCMGVASISKIDQIRCIKSLRRYIWKTYISKHRKCLRSFINLTLHQRMHLQPGSSCFASLAYVCWLMQALTTNDVALAIGRGQCTYSTYGSRDHCPLAEFKNSLTNKLVRFYSVWGALLIGIAESGETVVKFHNMKVEHTRNYSFSHTYKNIPLAPSPDDSEKYGVYFVSPAHLKELSNLRCGCKSGTADYVPQNLAEDTVERFYPDATSVLKFIDPQKSKIVKSYIYL